MLLKIFRIILLLFVIFFLVYITSLVSVIFDLITHPVHSSKILHLILSLICMTPSGGPLLFHVYINDVLYRRLVFLSFFDAIHRWFTTACAFELIRASHGHFHQPQLMSPT